MYCTPNSKNRPSLWLSLGLPSAMVMGWASQASADVVVPADTASAANSQAAPLVKPEKCHWDPTGSWTISKSDFPFTHADAILVQSLFQDRGRLLYSEMLKDSAIPGVNNLFSLPKSLAPARVYRIPGYSGTKTEPTEDSNNP